MADGAMRHFAGAMVAAAGVLLATLSGLCSLVVLSGVLGPLVSRPSSAGHIANLGVQLFAILTIGGLPFAVGCLMVVFGNALMKSGAKPPKRDP